jgi:hypothetical protein
MAWNQSEIFARDFRDGKRRRLGVEVFVFQVPAARPEAMLALFDDRREHEAVVDSSLITNVSHVPDPGTDGEAR